MRQMIVASALCDSIDSPPANGSNAGKAREKPRLELHSFDRPYSPTAVARSDFSTMRADLPRRLRR